MNKVAEQFKRKTDKSKEKEEKPIEHFVSTGSTLLNLALSDDINGGWVTGHMVHIIGDSNTGKSLEAMTILAEAAHDPFFNNYLLEDFDRESSREFDVQKLFGKKTKERITKAPFMETVEEWDTHLHILLDKEIPFVHVIDSYDAISCDADMKAIESMAKGKDPKGSYGTQKAKWASSAFRKIVGRLNKTGSLLVLVSQTRDNINAGTFAAARKYSGGSALTFYGHQRVWLAVKQTLKSKDRPIGSQVAVKVDRTRVTGKKRTVEFPIYYDYGIDDIGSMVDFLTINNEKDDGYWKKNKNTIVAEELGIEASRSKLIEKIENEGHYDKVRKLTGELWHDIEESLKLNRKPKYPRE